MTSRHDSVIVDVDLVDTVIFVGAVELSEDNLAEVVEFRDVACLCVPDKSVDLVIDHNVVVAEFSHKLIFAHFTAHVGLDRLSDFILVLVGGGVSDKLTVLGGASVVGDIEGGNRGDWLLHVWVEGADLLSDFGELCCLRILEQVVSQFGSAPHFLFDGVEQLGGVDFAIAVVLVDFEQALVLLDRLARKKIRSKGCWRRRD